jgi:hypothetical protein
MTHRRIACLFAAALALVASASPTHALNYHAPYYVTNSVSGTVSIQDGTSNVLMTDRVQTGNLPSGSNELVVTKLTDLA